MITPLPIAPDLAKAILLCHPAMEFHRSITFGYCFGVCRLSFEQLAALCAIVDNRFNITRAATELNISQPGLSKQIRLLEKELGFDVLARLPNRIGGLTEPGRDVVSAARRVLRDAADITRISRDYPAIGRGRLVVATTHIAARYLLLDIVQTFMDEFPRVQLALRQAAPSDILNLVKDGSADLGLLGNYSAAAEPDIGVLPCRSLSKSVIVPCGHPLAECRPLTLKAVARYRLITFDLEFASGAALDRTFRKHGFTPDLVLTATDSDVIKAYVRRGLGVGIIPSIAYEVERDLDIVRIEADHLFDPTEITAIIRENAYVGTAVQRLLALLKQ